MATNTADWLPVSSDPRAMTSLPVALRTFAGWVGLIGSVTMGNTVPVAESTGQLTSTVVTEVGANVVATGRGRLSAVLTNTALGGVITIYDSATDATGVVLGYLAADTGVGTFQVYGIPFARGITISQETGGSTLTVVYTNG